MLDSLPRWLYCCLTLALRAAVASMAEFDLPGVEWRGEPLLMEATTHNTRLAGDNNIHNINNSCCQCCSRGCIFWNGIFIAPQEAFYSASGGSVIYHKFPKIQVILSKKGPY